MTHARVTAPVPWLEDRAINERHGHSEEDVHVIVEACVIATVLLEQAIRVGHAKVFKVKQAVRVVLADELHKPVFIDLLIVDLRGDIVTYLSTKTSYSGPRTRLWGHPWWKLRSKSARSATHTHHVKVIIQ